MNLDQINLQSFSLQASSQKRLGPKYLDGGKLLVKAFRKYITSHGQIVDFATSKGIIEFGDHFNVWPFEIWMDIFIGQVERSLLYLSENIPWSSNCQILSQILKVSVTYICGVRTYRGRCRRCLHIKTHYSVNWQCAVDLWLNEGI